MFPMVWVMDHAPVSFPRVRGDVPDDGVAGGGFPTFSPRARGCSGNSLRKSIILVVFPACAGMFLVSPTPLAQFECFPRVRGDVPMGSPTPKRGIRFSPRARGCSYSCFSLASISAVFPACAGMFPHQNGGEDRRAGFPACAGMFR